MTELPDLLQSLEEQWCRHDLSISQNLRPGLPSDEVRERLAQVGIFDPPLELVEWFTWRDGASENFAMTPIIRIERLSYCAHVYPLQMEGVMRDPFETPGMFPIATYMAGECLVVDCSRPGELAVTTMQSREIELLPEPYHVPSLATVVSWWVDLFARERWAAQPGKPDSIISHLSAEEAAGYPFHAAHQGIVL